MTTAAHHPSRLPASTTRRVSPGMPRPAARRAARARTEEFAELLREEAPRATVEQLARAHPARVRRRRSWRSAPSRASSVQLDADTADERRQRRGGAARRGRRGGRRGRGDGGLGARRLRRRPARPATTPSRRARWGSASSTTPRSPPQHARPRWGLRRVAVVDFDVHHGNGTQAMFAAGSRPVLWLEPSVPVLSRHRPRVGARGRRTTSSTPRCRPGSDGAAFRAAWRDAILPALDGSRRSC